MSYDLKKIASDWIAYARFGSNEAPDQIFADGRALYDLVEDAPATAWDVIQIVVRRYTLNDLYSLARTEAQDVVGLTAAGPLEDIISSLGHDYIDVIEQEARQDQRMAWTLGGVWKSTTPDDVWSRVQLVADHTYWERPARLRQINVAAPRVPDTIRICPANPEPSPPPRSVASTRRLR